MTSRSQILKTILANQPAFKQIGELLLLRQPNQMPLIEEFCQNLSTIAVTVRLLDHIEPLLDEIHLRKVKGENIVSNLHTSLSSSTTSVQSDLVNPGFVDTVYLLAQLAVAENGAVWVDDHSLTHRIIPFLCDSLKLVINASAIVKTLHDAYRQIDFASIGYGTFIAGPSKTADIEQSLVIGAHGAKSCEVYILTNN